MSTRSILIAAASAAALALPTAASSAGCSVDKFKITKRHNVTCKKAKQVTHAKVSEKPLPKGWKCTDGSGIIPEGKCTKGDKSFKYAYAG
jgi:hypothetical protein